MRFVRFAAIAALLLQLPYLVMAADVTTETMRSSTANSLACVTGLKSVTTGVDATKFSDKLKQALQTGNGLDQLTAEERSFYNGLQSASAACDAVNNAHRGLMNDLAAMFEKGNLPPAGFKTEFDKMATAYNTANAAQAEASKVPAFAAALNRASSKK